MAFFLILLNWHLCLAVEETLVEVKRCTSSATVDSTALLQTRTQVVMEEKLLEEGAPGSRGNDTRNGSEEQLKYVLDKFDGTADFHILLKVFADAAHTLGFADKVPQHRNDSESWNSIWTHPLVLGVLLGLFLIGPDHLGTLMALSTLTSGFESFKSGFYWGVGHSMGVMLLCPIFLALEHVTSKAISKESWEYYGNIFIGTSMITVSAYFIYYESSYLTKLSDGTYVVKGCACHGPSSLRSPQDSNTACSNDLDEALRLKRCMPCDLSSPSESSESETINLEDMDNFASIRDFAIKSLLGLLQGLCCPIGMTAGTGFMSRVTATASTPMILGFILEFILASGVGSGAIAFGWGFFTTKGSGTAGRFIYIATCLMLFLFGVVWLVANSLGVLDHIDFGNKIHENLVSNADHS